MVVCVLRCLDSSGKTEVWGLPTAGGLESLDGHFFIHICGNWAGMIKWWSRPQACIHGFHEALASHNITRDNFKKPDGSPHLPLSQSYHYCLILLLYKQVNLRRGKIVINSKVAVVIYFPQSIGR